MSRERAMVIGSLTGLCLLAWLYLFYLGWQMGPMHGGTDMAMTEPRLQGWSGTELLLCFIMWIVMMVGMMLPSATPMILVYHDTCRKRLSKGTPYLPTALFVLGYVAVWSLFSVLATAAQDGLHSSALLTSAMGKSSSPVMGGAILLAAGIFQWTPLKERCLTHCRSPLNFLLNEWRDGRMGAWVLGLRHGLFCLGCCWALMLLMFVTGVMNLLWVALIGGFVLVEKVAPLQRLVSAGSGALLSAWGLWMLLAG